MCGIAGVYGCNSRQETGSFINTLTQGLKHRGPDGRGEYQGDSIALVHTRLSIIDTSEKGAQPFYNEDRSLVLICNGEIYNYKELRKELEEKGHRFSSNSDSEVIIHLYEEYRNDVAKLINRLTGMFCFAIWDTHKKKLIIARDRIGIKPMYYCYNGKVLGFASEVKPLHASGLLDFTIDYTSLYEYFLLSNIPGPNTLYNEIKCLEPGTYMTLENDKLSFCQYWDIPFMSRKYITERKAQEQFETLFSTVINDHLVADVPVGTFLSAGIDSSVITAMAVAHHPGINSFTATFPNEPVDEGELAKNTALKLKTTHFELKLENNFFDDYITQYKNLDQPFASLSALSLGRISKMASSHVKVILSGDGGDELFGGYSRHQRHQGPRFLRYIPTGFQNDFLKMAALATGKKSLEQLRKTLLIPDSSTFLDRIELEEPSVILSMFPPEIIAQIDTGRFMRRVKHLFDLREGDDRLNKTLYVDMKTTLVDEMLTKCDRMTMINGVEGRVPFLDHRMVEFAFSLPERLKRNKGIGKILLRAYVAKVLGDKLGYRHKSGFGSPFDRWLSSDKETNDFVIRNLEEAKTMGFINSGQLNKIISNIQSARPQLIFGLICLNTYYKNNAETNTREKTPNFC